MDMGNLGKWAWVIGFALAVLGGLLAGLGMDVLPAIVGTIALTLAFIGGILHLSKGDRTAFFIAAAALTWFAAGAGSLFVDMLGGVVAGILTGAAAGAAAGAAGVLLVVVYEWIRP
jgi:hypothetical protein